MKVIPTAMHRVSALALALIGAAGCATARPDLEALKTPVAKVEPVALPSDIVRASTVPAGATGRKEPGVILAGAEEEPSTLAGGPARRSGEEAPKLEERLKIPKELPGADAQIFRLPEKTTGSEAAYDEAKQRLFPSLPEPPPFDAGRPAAPRAKLTLGELEQIALANSPIIPQYESDITAAIGSAIQAGTHPNPIVGFENDTVGSSQNRDYWGAYASQIIKTAGKLELAQAVENVDLMNSQLMMRQTRNDLLTQVRRQYFALLIARESMKINEAVVRFTHEVYRIQVDQATAGQAAAYEPPQLRTFAVQARANLVAARNRYIAAWQQLAATLNRPNMPVADLADHPDMPVPLIDADAAVSHVLGANTEIRAARNGPIRARFALRLAEIIPIPDLFAYMTIQKDFTTPGLPHASYNSQLGVPLPIFDRNKGNILSARGALVRATEEMTRVENDLRFRLADAFERFETNRVLVGYVRDQILPDSVRAYRGTYERHIQEVEVVGFADVVVAQQNLLNSVVAYINALTGQWNAFVDIAALLQIESLAELQLQLRGPAADPQEGDVPAVHQDLAATVSEILSVSDIAAAASSEKGKHRRHIPPDGIEFRTLTPATPNRGQIPPKVDDSLTETSNPD